MAEVCRAGKEVHAGRRFAGWGVERGRGTRVPTGFCPMSNF